VNAVEDCGRDDPARGLESLYDGADPTAMCDALAGVIDSIAFGETACGAMLEAGAGSVRRMVGDCEAEGCCNDYTDVLKLIGSVRDLTLSVSELGALLTSKMSLSLDASACCEGMTYAGREVLNPAARGAVTDVMRNLSGEVAGVRSLIDSGAYALGSVCRGKERGCVFADSGNAEILRMFDEVNGLVGSAAQMEETLAVKTCVSVNALCAGTAYGEPCRLDRSILENSVESIALFDGAVCDVMEQGAAALNCYDLCAQPTEIVDKLGDLTDAVIRLCGASANNLNCSLAALCGIDSPEGCACECAVAIDRLAYPAAPEQASAYADCPA
jgi:hypothetical protein